MPRWCPGCRSRRQTPRRCYWLPNGDFVAWGPREKDAKPSGYGDDVRLDPTGRVKRQLPGSGFASPEGRWWLRSAYVDSRNWCELYDLATGKLVLGDLPGLLRWTAGGDLVRF